VRAFALIELGDNEAIDVFLRRETPTTCSTRSWPMNHSGVGMLYVAPIELDERNTSLN
jgi:hypothetical protein